MQGAANFNVAIFPIKGNAYRISFKYMNKNDAINIMTNSNLNQEIKKEKMKNEKIIIIFYYI